MKEIKFGSQSGVSIIEVLLVLVIATILGTIALGQFGNSRKNFQRQNLSREFKNDLERARFDSVKRRASTTAAMAHVDILSPTSFSVSTDLNMDGTLQTIETRQVDFTNRIDASLIAGSTSYPLTIRFDHRGQTTITNSLGATVSSSFTVCGSGCTSSTANASNADVIYISPTGTIAMSAGGTVLPTFANPSVTNVTTTSNIDNRVQVNSSNYPY